MPMYEFKCHCGKRFDRFLRIGQRDAVQFCYCGARAERVLSAPAVVADYPGYNCPVTGNWIEGRKAHEANLAKHNCRVFETGERENFLARKKAEEEAFLETVSESVAAEVANMPQRKQEQLCTELAHGADITYERKGV